MSSSTSSQIEVFYYLLGSKSVVLDVIVSPDTSVAALARAISADSQLPNWLQLYKVSACSGDVQRFPTCSLQIDQAFFAENEPSDLETLITALLAEKKLLYLSPVNRLRRYVEDTNNELCVVVKPLCEYLSLIS